MIRKKKEVLAKKLREFDFSSYKKYCQITRYLSYKVYGKKTPQGQHIDHIYSLKNGFENRVPLEIISNQANLRLLPADKNLKKGNRSDISIEELYSRVGAQRLAEMA